MKKTLVIGHLYPQQMNIYGDNGNVLALKRRTEWRNLPVKILEINPGEVKAKLKECDIIIGGGGQDSGQEIVERDVVANKQEFRAAANNGIVALVVCGLYQLFGHSFQTVSGRLLTGAGIFDAETVGFDNRMIGNVVIDTNQFGQLVGFENHSGKTQLLNEQQSFGIILQGKGNNGEDGTEGAVYKNIYGSYLHGPLLPKNPVFTDYLIAQAISRKFGETALIRLGDDMENSAAEAAKKLAY